MIEQSIENLRPDGLDTLSERALRRLTDGWTGRLHSVDTLEYSSENVATDNTFSSIIEGWRKARERYHSASVEEVFGSSSSLSEGVVNNSEQAVENALAEGGNVALDGVNNLADSLALGAAEEWQLATDVTDVVGRIASWADMLSPIYNILIVLVAIFYMFCIYRYFDDIVVLFSSVFNRNVVSSDRTSERRHSDIFYGSLGKLFLLGVCFVGLLCGMWCQNVGLELPTQVVLYLPFAVILSFFAVIAVQYLMLMAVGFVTRSLSEVASLLRIRLIYFVLTSVMVSPILLISQMGTSLGYQMWQKVGFVAAFVALGLFFRESIKLFISKKVSILHWILYLCAVEILPITLLWQAVVRLS
ncbi:MAG: DUF4271 domain-containing protein [Alistipes sp.]|nr:DUF4271 domain-containing protein [Alistipes sp.]